VAVERKGTLADGTSKKHDCIARLTQGPVPLKKENARGERKRKRGSGPPKKVGKGKGTGKHYLRSKEPERESIWGKQP